MTGPDRPAPPPLSNTRVALFVTCLTEAFYPRAAIAVVKVLEHLGCTVEFPRDQTCCGQPMHNNGFASETAALARRMITIFEGFPYVITPSGSCAAMVKTHYPHVLAHDPVWAARAADLAARTFEFGQFISDVLHTDLTALGAEWKGDASYHPSCHLRLMGTHATAHAPLEGVPGLRLKHLDNAEQCCGFGGAFSLRQPDLSGSLAKDKAEAARRAGCSLLVCNDAGCAMSIEGACRRAGVPVRMVTTPEIIAQALGLMTREAP